MNADLIAEISPAIRELAQGWREKDSSLCLTFALEGSDKVWVQLTRDSINIGLLEGEDRGRVAQELGKSGKKYIEQDYQAGLFYTVGVDVVPDDKLVVLVHDILVRHAPAGDHSVNVEFIEL